MDTQRVRDRLQELQAELISGFESAESRGRFLQDPWRREAGEGGLAGEGMTALLEGGAVFERAAVAVSDVRGATLPAAASARHPHLAGRSFRAVGLSMVSHPRNPAAPTSHLNVRCFSAGETWWFGGGFDLTPYLPFDEDVVQWHRAAASACAPFGPHLHAVARANCDEYFFLRHREEARGVGGLFFDDLNQDTPRIGMHWRRCLELLVHVATAYREAYLAIVGRRSAEPYGERERAFQLYRRGRYVEFNLLLDRGTLFGLQSGGRTDAILMSMPPLAAWSYRTPDAELEARLRPYLTSERGRDWLTGTATQP